MFRNTILALGAIGTLGVAALAPSSASAWHFGHHHHFRFGGIYLGPTYAYDSCIQKHWIDTRFGPRLHWVNVCAY